MLEQEFRDLMTGVCAPVTVVTTADDDGPHGATVSSFASLSLSPALVTVALDRRSALLGRILGSRRFGVNVLASSDDDLALLFARRGVAILNRPASVSARMLSSGTRRSASPAAAFFFSSGCSSRARATSSVASGT